MFRGFSHNALLNRVVRLAGLMLLCLPGISDLNGQLVAGNEWIHYDQPYWRFSISAPGVYRISYQQLQQAGFPVGNTDPQFIGVYGRGREHHIRMIGAEDGSLDPGDAIELYATGNDGWLDSLVYDSPNSIANPWFSLFNDTAQYFLTIQDTPGKRTWITEESDFSGLTPAPYCFAERKLEEHVQYLIGRQDQNGISLPWYEVAEGWFGGVFPKGASYHRDVPTPQAYTGEGAPDAQVYAVSGSASLAPAFPNHHLQVGWGNTFNLVKDTTYYGYALHKVAFTIPANSLGSTVTRITHRSVDDLGVAVDNHAVAWVSVSYARSWDFGAYSGEWLALEDTDADGVEYININGLSGEGYVMDVMMGGIFSEATLYPDNGSWHGLVHFPPGVNRVRMLLRQTGEFSVVDGIEGVTQSGYFTDYQNQSEGGAMLMVAPRELWSSAQNYAAYRQSTGLDVVMADVEELYMQYAAGVRKHPLAIRRFCRHMLNSWSEPPSYLFLIGKSIHEMYISASATGSRSDVTNYSNNLVPTWGWPASDAAFTAGLVSGIYDPAIPVGRISAHTDEQVLEYLSKVIEHEAQEPASWQKNIIHFGGGSISYEQNLFNSYLNNYKAIAQDTSYAAKVFTFLKSTTDPIQISLSDSIHQLINQGVAVMTFFGHASSTGFDQNIDSPESYNNQGKYPLLIGNSCYTGNIHLGESLSMSERFVLVPDRGVIGFLAKSDLGIPNYLDLFTGNFYRNLFSENYGQSVGYCMAQAVRDFQQTGDFYRENTALTFALHGDPSVHLYTWPIPDYEVQNTDVSFDPPSVSAQLDSFDVVVHLRNLGKAIHGQVGVELIRSYPDGTDSSYFKVISELLNEQEVRFTLPIDPLRGTGQNTFSVFVDYPASLIGEMDDVGNNIATAVTLNITSGDLIPVRPYPFAVVPQEEVTLYASTGYALEPEKSYVIQIDTTDTFDSPFMQSQIFTQTGGVVEWDLPFELEDSTVYFWRCSADSLNEEAPFRWRLSSFQYIEGETGWGQDHFYQFGPNEYSGVSYNRDDRDWTFTPLLAELKCEVYGSASTSFEALATRYQIDLEVQDYSGIGSDPALMVAVIDSVSLQPWESNWNGTNPENEFGNTLASANARNRAERYFIFQQDDPVQLDGLAQLLQEEIPDGNYLLVYTWQFAAMDTWPDNLSQAFEDIGASSLNSAQDSVPFILFTRAGHPDETQVVFGSDAQSYLAFTHELEGVSGRGEMHSPRIGPAASWQEASWEFIMDSTSDSSTVRLFGISGQGQETLLGEWQDEPGLVPGLDGLIDAAQYPFLRYAVALTDGQLQSPPQCDKWHILLDEVPECALDASSGFLFEKDTIGQGEELKVAIAVRNLTPYPMDSLLVDYTILRDDGTVEELDYPRQAPLPGGAMLMDTLIIASTNLEGLNRLRIEVNPLDEVSGQFDQAEQHHFNNLLEIPFVVQGDRINPLLDVTFDGMHILNEDIVSAQPDILVRLDDENPFLLMNSDADTALFRIYLTDPLGIQTLIPFADPRMSWTTAGAENNRFEILFRPTLDRDGMYELRVQASDLSGNASGMQDYRVRFEVVNKPGITEVLNYPNPFSTSTRFVFTLTGSEIPDQIKIQIMTVGGDIVREITQDEIGPLRIGRNLTEFAWDGTDEFGDRLANGVYLYRVQVLLRGQPVEVRETGASGYFTRGVGKMFLMR